MQQSTSWRITQNSHWGQINETLRVQLPQKPHICPSTLSSLLHGQLITVKKMEYAPQNRNTDDVKQQRRIYCEWLLQGDAGSGIHELVYIDESGFNL